MSGPTGFEDKLSHDERLRLECLAQAVASGLGRMTPASAPQLVASAQIFEEYVKGDQ